jgi:hypothetical protein
VSQDAQTAPELHLVRVHLLCGRAEPAWEAHP